MKATVRAFAALQPVREREPDGARQALPQRPAREIDDGSAFGRDRLEQRAVGAVPLELLLGQQADFSGDRVEDDGVVAR